MNKEVEERIEGLILQSEFKTFKESVSEIVKDLRDEGFAEEDVRNYLKNQVDEIALHEYL